MIFYYLIRSEVVHMNHTTLILFYWKWTNVIW